MAFATSDVNSDRGTHDASASSWHAAFVRLTAKGLLARGAAVSPAAVQKGKNVVGEYAKTHSRKSCLQGLKGVCCNHRRAE